MEKAAKAKRKQELAAAALKRKQESIENKLRRKLAALEKTALGATATSDASKAGKSGKRSASICYLCRKKFKSEAMLLRHNAESALHKENLRKKAAAEAQTEHSN